MGVVSKYCMMRTSSLIYVLGITVHFLSLNSRGSDLHPQPRTHLPESSVKDWRSAPPPLSEAPSRYPYVLPAKKGAADDLSRRTSDKLVRFLKCDRPSA